MRLPSLLVPYPTAADDHQFHNARAFETTGAARLLEQKNATPEKVSALLRELVENEAARAAMQTALVQWYAPKAADQIAENILSAIEHETADKVEGHSRPRVSRSTPRRTHSDETDSIAV
jgi:UDP-N-acetylglucosamine--N-acetylmuramyl-(pentapeptide) pyrophosphoryl-undecaprenol N-acetylglucosamine transferase